MRPRCASRCPARVGARDRPLALEHADGTLTIEGEVANVAAKKLALGRAAAVTLAGIVPTDSEPEMAKFDAWYVFGVDRVDNRIEVRPFPPTGG